MPAEEQMVPTRYNYQFIHNVFGHFFKDMLDYFADYLYPRFDFKVVGTYDKAVEWINKTTQYDREIYQPMRPALILNPSGDFVVDETYGSMLWRYPNLYPGFVKYVFDPVYQDQHMIVNVGFTRFRGEVEFIALVPSFYEYSDLKVFLNLIFGGQNRYIYPLFFNSFIIIPDELKNYEYYNPVTGLRYRLNWEECGAWNQLVETTAKTEYVIPCKIKPKFRFTAMSDASTRLGGQDKLPDWRLAFTVEYEVEVPSFVILQSDYLAENIQFNIGYGSCYSSNEVYNNEDVSMIIDSFTSHWDLGLDSTSNSTIIIPNHVDILDDNTREFKTRYFHIVTEQEADSTADIEIVLPEVIDDPRLLAVVSKNGPLTYWDHYTIDDNGTILTIKHEYVHLDSGDVIELYVYTFTGGET